MNLVACSKVNDFVSVYNNYKKTNITKDFIVGLQGAAGFRGIKLGEEKIEGDYFLNVEFDNGIAVVDVVGMIMPGFLLSIFANFFGICPLGNLIKTLQLLSSRNEVHAIILKMDSPGGSVSGVANAANDISILKDTTPIYAYVGDLCASAAYWLASACKGITSSLAGCSGSIGVLYVEWDFSNAYSNMGLSIRVHTNDDADKKYLEGGLPIVAKEMRRELGEIAEGMIGYIAKGRGIVLEEAKKLWGDGRVHYGSMAEEKKLVDEIGFLTNLKERLKKKINNNLGGVT